MTALKKYSRYTGALSRREKIEVLVFFIVLILAILYGMYLGAWSLHREEEMLPEHSSTK
jgi:cytochrome oxidase assembly protein ShyY1